MDLREGLITITFKIILKHSRAYNTMTPKISNLFSLLIFVSLFFSCEETPPDINLHPVNIDSTWVDSSNIVTRKTTLVVEEITGVRCANCIEGHKKLLNLVNTNSGSVIGVSLHTGEIYVTPYPQSKDDFRTQEGSAIELWVGEPEGRPSAYINRVYHSTENKRVVFIQDWQTVTDSLLKTNSPVNIDLVREFNATTRSLMIGVKVQFTKQITGPINLSVIITQDSIVDAQLTDTKIDTNYVHHYALRTMMTPYNGILLATSAEKGRGFYKELRKPLNLKWKSSNCYVIAMVHYSGARLEVLNAAEVGVGE